MLPGANGLPDPANIQSFVGVDATGGAAGHPVDLKIGPDQRQPDRRQRTADSGL
jgi:hypothetical protein